MSREYEFIKTVIQIFEQAEACIIVGGPGFMICPEARTSEALMSVFTIFKKSPISESQWRFKQ